MNYTKFIKRALGVIVVVNFVPVLFITISALRGDVADYGHFGYWGPYLGGWSFNVFFAIVVALFFFVSWCFD